MMELFSIFGRILLKDDGVEDKLKNVNKQAEETESKLSNLGKNMESFGKGLSNIGKGLLTHLTLPLAAAGGAIVKFADKASDLNEAKNVIENTFKSSAKAIEDWTNTTAKSAGISKTSSSQWVGFMGAMLKSSGVAEQAAGDMSKKLVQLTGDMSSFYNIGTSDMWEKIRAGMSGETMPLKQLGINMSVANLEAYALAQGIKKPYKEMSQSEQTILRYNYLLSVTKDAQGDFARTLNDSFANQVRVGKLNLETIVTTIGSKFLPSIMSATKGINNFAEALNNALNGKDESAVLGKTINNIANAINKLNPQKIKDMAGLAGALASLGPGVMIIGKLIEGTGKFENGIGKAIETVTKFSGSSISSIKKFEKSASSTLSKFGDLTLFKKLGSGIETLQIKGLYAFDTIKNGATSKLAPIGNTVSKIFSKIPSAITGPVSKVSSFIGAESPKLKAAFGDLGGKVTDGLKNMVGLALKLIGPAALIGTLLVGLEAVQEKFGKQIDKFANIAITKGPQIITQFVQGITTKIPLLINEGVILVQTLLNVIIANAPALINGAVQIITTLVNGISTNLPKLIPVVLKLIQTILTAIVNNLPLIIQAGLNLLVALAQGISNNIDKVVDTIVKVITEIIKVLAQNAPLLIKAGIQILVALIEGISKAIPQLIAALPQIVKAIWDGLKNVDWGSLGSAIIQGIGEGIKAAAGGLWNTVKAVGSDILQGFKAMFGIHSPSTVFRDQIGKNISLGIVQGISDVDFTQTISDILNDGTNDAKASAKKVADAVSMEISKIKGNTTQTVRDLNKQLTQLSEQETIALRGVKGTARYAIEDEYNKKKQTIKDEIQLRKEQANKEIAEIKRMGAESKDELQQELDDRKSFIENVNSLNDQIKEALKTKYTEEEEAAEDSINKQIEYWEDWKTKSEDAINSVFDEKEKRLEDDQKATEDTLEAESDALEQWKETSEDNIDDVANAKIAVLKDQEDVFDAQSTANDRASTHKEYEDRISDLKNQIKYSHDDYNTAELQKQLQQEQVEYQKELDKEALEDKKAALKKQEDIIQADANKQKKNIESIYKVKKADIEKRTKDEKAYYENKKALMENNKEAQLANIMEIYNKNKTALDKQLEDTKAFYAQRLLDANLEAEAEKMIIDKNQKEIVALLNSYSEEYKQAGQTLGDRLVEGFEPAIQQIKDMISSITAKISAARNKAIKAMSSSSDITVSKSVNWHADGGIFDRPSIIGVGEGEEPEAVVPIDKLVSIIREAFSGDTKDRKIEVNNTFNSPIALKPSEETRQAINEWKKAAFELGMR